MNEHLEIENVCSDCGKPICDTCGICHHCENERDDRVKAITGFTYTELDKAFKLVQNKEHWKNPINSYCTSDEVKVVAAAIEYFTATEAHFDYLGVKDETNKDRGNPRFKIGDHILLVRADGYRKGPAGDH